MKEGKIEMIKASSIKVVLPRTRNKFKHAEITESINTSGIRKPVTVRRIKDSKYEYALICGQGRLESISMLNEELIPAIILDVDENTAHIMSLAENMARVLPRAGQQYLRIKDMKEQGLSNKEISENTGLSVNWITSLTMLIEKGENKLLSAVENGTMSISLAVEIARVDYKEGQELFIKAFDEGKIKHKDVSKLREVLDSRNEGLKGIMSTEFKRDYKSKKLTTDQLIKVYEDSIKEHKNLIHKASYLESNLLLANSIFNELNKNKDFNDLIISENLNDIIGVIFRNSAKD
ncbi:chromosome partitioning protein ParB [Izhakiella australiensis]|uniref:Chromosome partitioning protein ParB n=1 Tax=Izhakiella australiensis TaxID=1926881 RepID=A0A1S8Y6H5_9GAMM|nr:MULTISPECIES: ParB/RepB/Spo0J family partition protein [Erwiniaceae]MCW0350410.1 Nucleoid occlusion protein [Pantoea ananatis]OON34650.1 chromosome partitioning protein ParB [Izhakiella australiensis]